MLESENKIRVYKARKDRYIVAINNYYYAIDIIKGDYSAWYLCSCIEYNHSNNCKHIDAIKEYTKTL
jgi:hypothetical protein